MRTSYVPVQFVTPQMYSAGFALLEEVESCHELCQPSVHPADRDFGVGHLGWGLLQWICKGRAVVNKARMLPNNSHLESRQSVWKVFASLRNKIICDLARQTKRKFGQCRVADRRKQDKRLCTASPRNENPCCTLFERRHSTVSLVTRPW